MFENDTAGSRRMGKLGPAPAGNLGFKLKEFLQ